METTTLNVVVETPWWETAAVVVATLFGGGLVALWLDRARAFLSRPKIAIITSDSGCDVENKSLDGTRTRHLRARISNTGRSAATGVSGYLLDISIVDSAGQRESFSGDVVTANWSHKGATPQSIPAQFDGFYVDLFGVWFDPVSSKIRAAQLLGSDMGNMLADASQKARRVVAQLVIAGDNFRPVKAPIQLSWDGHSTGAKFE